MMEKNCILLREGEHLCSYPGHVLIGLQLRIGPAASRD